MGDKTMDSDFAATEGLVEPFVEYRELTLNESLGTGLKELKEEVHQYHKALLKTYKSLTPKNSAKAKSYKAEINRINDKWSRVFQLERYKQDEEQQPEIQLMKAKIPKEEEIKLVHEGDLDQLRVRKAVFKMATFHDDLVSEASVYNEEKWQDYLMAYDLLVKPLKTGDTWDSR